MILPTIYASCYGSLPIIRRSLATAAVFVVAGCGGNEFPIATVSGIVTLDGQPLANAHVGFEPISTESSSAAGPGSYGMTNDKGEFNLESLDGEDGAVVGSHRVAIRTYRAERLADGGRKVIRKEVVPHRYNLQSELTFVVPPQGTDSADFDLQSK